MNNNGPHSVNQSRRRSRHRGMTLIEILVVILIILILLGIGVAAITGAMTSRNIARTRAVLKQLEAAHEEYRAQTGETIEFDGSSPANRKDESISEFIDEIATIPEAKKIFLMVEKDEWTGTRPNDELPYALNDPWKTPYQYRDFHLGGRVVDGDNDVLARGTQSAPQPFFMSAGPDEVFGTEDDIFSYIIE